MCGNTQSQMPRMRRGLPPQRPVNVPFPSSPPPVSPAAHPSFLGYLARWVVYVSQRRRGGQFVASISMANKTPPRYTCKSCPAPDYQARPGWRWSERVDSAGRQCTGAPGGGCGSNLLGNSAAAFITASKERTLRRLSVDAERQ